MLLVPLLSNRKSRGINNTVPIRVMINPKETKVRGSSRNDRAPTYIPRVRDVD